MTSRTGTRIRAVLAAFATLCLVATVATTGPTRAEWTDREQARATLTARIVAKPTGLTCTGGVLTGGVTFTWAAPATKPKGGYAWTITGVVNRSGTLDASATSLTQTVPLVTLGTATFTLRAKGKGKWTSQPVSKTFRILTGGVISC